MFFLSSSVGVERMFFLRCRPCAFGEATWWPEDLKRMSLDRRVIRSDLCMTGRCEDRREGVLAGRTGGRVVFQFGTSFH